MLRLCLKLLLTITAACLLLIGGVRALTHDETYTHTLRAFLQLPENCAQPCFLGIHRGQFPSQIIQRLAGHPWVDGLSRSDSALGYTMISWEWSDQGPALLPAGAESSLMLTYDRIDHFYIGEGFSLGDLWLAFGAPTHGLMTAQHHFVDYAHFSLRTSASCRYFWQATGSLIIRYHAQQQPYDPHAARRALCRTAS